MTDRPSRRWVLRTGLATGCALVAGCLSSSGDTDPPDATATTTTAGTPATTSDASSAEQTAVPATRDATTTGPDGTADATSTSETRTAPETTASTANTDRDATADPTTKPIGAVVASETATPRLLGTVEFDVSISNGDTASHRVAVAVERISTSDAPIEPITDLSVDVDPGERSTRDVAFAEPGTYRFVARLDGGSTATHEHDLPNTSEADAMAHVVDIDGSGDVGFSHFYV